MFITDKNSSNRWRKIQSYQSILNWEDLDKKECEIPGIIFTQCAKPKKNSIEF
jgi:hypothetical protein